jgi:hypothetical protein
MDITWLIVHKGDREIVRLSPAYIIDGGSSSIDVRHWRAAVSINFYPETDS